MSLQETINTLLTWCSGHGIVTDSRLSILPGTNGGIGVYTEKEGIPSGEAVVVIPKHVVLSARSCSLAKFITPAIVGSEAQLALSLALYSELLLGQTSEWYGYLQSLPEHIDLPICWKVWLSRPEYQPDLSAEDLDDIKGGLKWMKGTEAEKMLCRGTHNYSPALEDIEQYFYDAVKPLLTVQGRLAPQQTVDLKGFLRAYCLVSSRAFLVDAYHGLAMVPIADAFNHVQEHHVHLETEHDVCPECGSLDECTHDRNGDEHSIIKSSFLDVDYEMVANTPIPPRSEVYNTYGEALSNAQLLCQHGFILEANDNDILTWTIEEVFDTLSCLSDPLRTAVSHTCSGYFNDPELMSRFTDTRCVFNCFEAAEESVFRVNADGQTKRVPALVNEAESRQTLQSLYGFQISLENQVDLLDDEDSFGDNALDALPDCLDHGHLGVLTQACRLLVVLVQTRRAHTGEIGHRDLVAVLDALDITKRRTRCSLLLAMGEKLILSSCETVWKDLLVALERAAVSK